ncbi:hypothetical protein XA68_16255 [Ophiocordyceps unilateralis]|uniref:DUF7923 domain-containing protein n=1 Tax=Ophiocordyceps unilateralis TaxID=268505 RepID=A0A2A9P6Z2_OPHUN|nr:hypothetical protein XA68_16255 [Ophiocordyceps unilateralis]
MAAEPDSTSNQSPPCPTPCNPEKESRTVLVHGSRRCRLLHKTIFRNDTTYRNISSLLHRLDALFLAPSEARHPALSHALVGRLGMMPVDEDSSQGPAQGPTQEPSSPEPLSQEPSSQNLQQTRDSSDQFIDVCKPQPHVLMVADVHSHHVAPHCDRTDISLSLHLENQRLLDELRLCQIHLADATDSRRHLEQQLQAAQMQLNAYVVVLIDGNEFIFHDRWTNHGIQGGRRAAQTLQAAVVDLFGNSLGGFDVVVRVFADLDRLARSLGRDDDADDYARFRDFAVGFTQTRSLFDFVAVSHGGKLTSSKLQETALWHLRNQNCKHVLLAMSDIASNALFLQELAQAGNAQQRVTAMSAGGPMVNGFGVVELGKDLFRTDRPTDRNRLFSDGY